MQDNNKILDQHVGHRMRERRKALGLTQAEMADILGLSHQQVQRYESGENTLSMARALEIAHVLNVKLEYLYAHAPLVTDAPEKSMNGIISRTLGRPFRLLLVEDNSSDELLFRKALERWGIPLDFDVIQSADKVIDYLLHGEMKYGKKIPDLILLDIHMARMNGLTVLRHIKTAATLKSIPVIMLTNSIRTRDVQEAYAQGCSGFIQKNSDLIGFYADVEHLLNYWVRTTILPYSS